MSVVSQTVDQQKLDRLTAAAQGGQQGLNEYDASQQSVAGERATMAAGLASDAKSAGYSGPALGGAPSVLSGQLNAGVNPYQTALANDRADFTQNLHAGLQANSTYLDAVKAAEAPALAAARSGSGGSGGGRSGGSAKPLTDTELTKVLLQAAAQQQAQHVSQINQSEQTAASGEKTAAADVAYQPTGPAFLPGEKLDLPSQRIATQGPPSPAQPAGPSTTNPQLTSALAARAASIASSRFQSKKAEQAAASILQTRVARQQRVEGESILPIAQSLAQQASAQSGDPTIAQRASYLLTPSVEETYRNAISAGLPKLSTAASKPAPVDTAVAAKALGLSGGALSSALGQTYVRSGYKPDGAGGYLSDIGKAARANAATGNLVNDIVASARIAASRGFDYQSWLDQGANIPDSVVQKFPAAAQLGAHIAEGYFPSTAAPVQTNPYVRYYDRLYPPVSVQ